VRIARALGDVSRLLPEGVSHLGDCPFTLHRAITDALRVLSYEEFPVAERPPRRIWEDAERLNEWWSKIDSERKAKFGLDDTTEEGPYEENALELISRG
jgi:hypothetical protein